ncbi:MAG: hypothetical protein WBA05_10520 [Gordonia sp. (in: high G+C Gram-positive bacteria)]|uniref:hypothetical protein n=1 Tax=Gordonia sp. (in: high G+C Gram-positive bacteria) TaxID=84139 RepID=UPI003C72727D
MISIYVHPPAWSTRGSRKYTFDVTDVDDAVELLIERHYWGARFTPVSAGGWLTDVDGRPLGDVEIERH